MERIKTRKIKNLIILVVILLPFPSISLAVVVNNVKKTVHNMGATNPIATHTLETTEICIFCHTPHNAVAGKRFLWNRIDTFAANQFMLYTASPTLNFAKGVVISEVSRMCMSCHDGATAMNSMANPRAPGFTMRIANDIYPIGGEWGPNIGGYDSDTSTGGKDLTNDHPISFEYQEAQSADSTLKIRDGGGKSVGGGLLPLWNNGDGKYRVECVTCHDPHIYYGNPGGRSLGQDYCDGVGDCSLRPFLRKSNSSSGLCFTCHNK